MFCTRCGSQIEGEHTFCPYCGATLENNRINTDLQTPAQPRTGYPYGPQSQGISPNDPLNDPRGMKWFKFIIYFWLFANAAGMVLNGILAIRGLYFTGGAGEVYSYFGNLRVLDIIIGLIYIALGGASIYVRQRLAKFRVNGPKLFLLLQAASIAVDLLYIIVASQIITGAPLFLMDSSTAAQNFAAFSFIIINYYYLKKRADLFTH